ncbi:6-carboxytetrahydropterin synthase [Brevundimonas diminuta]|uniref:6-carboxytetrahydropterin synthase n=1 Tax=Brevundimonas diminuta TaxID=293 RepID=UPI003F7E8384
MSRMSEIHAGVWAFAGPAQAALDFTETTFDAAHKGEFADQVHGHTWHVRIYWPAEACCDARYMHDRLTGVVSEWDHTLLDGKVEPNNYGVCKAVAERISGLSKIRVWRGGKVPCGAEVVL